MRVSKADGSQVLDLQRDALSAAGVGAEHLYEDHASGKRDVGLRVLAGEGAAIDTTTANGRLMFGFFAALAEFERELIVERTKAGLASACARDRNGGRPYKMTAAKLRLAQAAMGQPSSFPAPGRPRTLGITPGPTGCRRRPSPRQPTAKHTVAGLPPTVSCSTAVILPDTGAASLPVRLFPSPSVSATSSRLPPTTWPPCAGAGGVPWANAAAGARRKVQAAANVCSLMVVLLGWKGIRTPRRAESRRRRAA